MKKIVFLAIAITAIMFTSCKKTENDGSPVSVDYTKPANISGTTWKTFSPSADPSMEWAALIFKSTAAVEGWSKYKTLNATKDWTGTFAIVNANITFNYSMDSIPETFSGTISGITITCPMGGGASVVFTKQ
ncbi:MAG: hypothetical protein NTW10_06005 [Bacteroidetes bacterium]|nr:hypothetical protein [Bacteroidota bacterium]